MRRALVTLRTLSASLLFPVFVSAQAAGMAHATLAAQGYTVISP